MWLLNGTEMFALRLPTYKTLQVNLAAAIMQNYVLLHAMCNCYICFVPLIPETPLTLWP